jgi:hypothetical protein
MKVSPNILKLGMSGEGHWIFNLKALGSMPTEDDKAQIKLTGNNHITAFKRNIVNINRSE